MTEKLRFQVPDGRAGECLSPEFGRFVGPTSKVAASRDGFRTRFRREVGTVLTAYVIKVPCEAFFATVSW